MSATGSYAGFAGMPLEIDGYELERLEKPVTRGFTRVTTLVRLRGAEALVQAGRRAEADAMLQQALAFYRSVGATRYIREAEALFAASA